MNRDSRREVLEEHKDVFWWIADSDLPAHIRRRYGRQPLNELERIRTESEESASSTDG
jgi:hypothetical protein